MNELNKTKLQTPIEIALGIDENGMTTARALYMFLEMNPAHFARWSRKNIEQNEFYEENKDWWGFTIVVNGNKCKDYRITTDFAKHLSMESHSAKGKIARQYFVKVEDNMKELASRFQNMSPELKAILVVDQRVTKIEKKAETLEYRFNRLEADMPVFSIDAKNIQSAVKKKGIQILGGKESNAYKNRSVRTSVYADIQCMLRRNFGVKRYEEIRHKQADIALKLIEDYTPPLFLRDRVNDENSQISFIFN